MIVTCIPVSAKKAFLTGEFQPGDKWMLALYTAGADLGEHCVTYTPAGESRGKGYRAGGVPLRGFKVWTDGCAACLGFDSVTLPNASITARGYLIYNASKGNKVAFVGDWGADFTSTEGPFQINIPADQIIFD